jgi:hypothetical protein
MPPASKKVRHPIDEALSARRRVKPPPHEFVLDALASLAPRTNPMFGCLAVYVGEKIVLILRESARAKSDNGVWLATTHEHHESLRRDFPGMRSIKVLGGGKETGWQVLRSGLPDFEDLALKAVGLIRNGDPRIGKVPKPKTKRKSRGKTAARAARK